MKAFLKWLGGIFTDALGRPEVKMMLGVPLLVVAVVYLLMVGAPGLLVFGALSTLALGLMGITAGADHKIDMATIAAGPVVSGPIEGK